MISAHQEYLISFVVCISMKEWSRVETDTGLDKNIAAAAK